MAYANPTKEPMSRPRRSIWPRKRCLLDGVFLAALHTTYTSKVTITSTLTAAKANMGITQEFRWRMPPRPEPKLCPPPPPLMRSSPKVVLVTVKSSRQRLESQSSPEHISRGPRSSVTRGRPGNAKNSVFILSEAKESLERSGSGSSLTSPCDIFWCLFCDENFVFDFFLPPRLSHF